MNGGQLTALTVVSQSDGSENHEHSIVKSHVSHFKHVPLRLIVPGPRSTAPALLMCTYPYEGEVVALRTNISLEFWIRFEERRDFFGRETGHPMAFTTLFG